ncbi:hypothetical protein HML84_14495 [Alcanivorax sp. IO_7]|nr:hypothetical protein HML84_14495 [Alcanivorax sp. IO_7]
MPGVSDLISGVLDDLVAETGLVPALSKEPHFDDQLALYDALVRSPEGLTDNDLTGYFKPSPLSAPDAGAWESEITVTGEGRTVAIKRDDYGVPHIFGDSRADALFGVGYVTAADRLFLLDVLRRAGRGELSRFLGPADFSFDRDIAVNAPTGKRTAPPRSPTRWPASATTAPRSTRTPSITWKGSITMWPRCKAACWKRPLSTWAWACNWSPS